MGMADFPNIAGGISQSLWPSFRESDFLPGSLPGQLLFYVARSGSVRMLQLLLDEMRPGIPGWMIYLVIE